MRLQANRRPQPLVICNEGRHRDLRAARGDSGPVCVPQCRAPQLLHPARALGSPWRARVNDSSAATPPWGI